MKKMNKLSSQVAAAFETVPGLDPVALKKAFRASEVRALWEQLVEDNILEHTNGVYILSENGKTIMKVYVDESIYAAELNNRRELLVLQCRKNFGELIDEFQIYISRGLMKQRYPFKEASSMPDQNPPRTLSSDELNRVEEACRAIDNDEVRAYFKKAMIADLEWKKGNPQ